MPRRFKIRLGARLVVRRAESIKPAPLSSSAQAMLLHPSETKTKVSRKSLK
jgi:hypothetical protein